MPVTHTPARRAPRRRRGASVSSASRDARASEHYEWSFAWGRFPRPESEAFFKGWKAEPDAGQDLRDSFARLVEPSQVLSPERLERWFSA